MIFLIKPLHEIYKLGPDFPLHWHWASGVAPALKMSHWKIRDFAPILGEDHKAFSLFLRCLNMSTELKMSSTPLMRLEYWKALLLHLVLSLQSQRVFLLWESEAERWYNFWVWHFTGWRAEPRIEFSGLCSVVLLSTWACWYRGFADPAPSKFGDRQILFYFYMFFMQLQLMHFSFS